MKISQLSRVGSLLVAVLIISGGISVVGPQPAGAAHTSYVLTFNMNGYHGGSGGQNTLNTVSFPYIRDRLAAFAQKPLVLSFQEVCSKQQSDLRTLLVTNGPYHEVDFAEFPRGKTDCLEDYDVLFYQGIPISHAIQAYFVQDAADANVGRYRGYACESANVFYVYAVCATHLAVGTTSAPGSQLSELAGTVLIAFPSAAVAAFGGDMNMDDRTAANCPSGYWCMGNTPPLGSLGSYDEGNDSHCAGQGAALTCRVATEWPTQKMFDYAFVSTSLVVSPPAYDSGQIPPVNGQVVSDHAVYIGYVT
jgi:hypothetical protein